MKKKLIIFSASWCGPCKAYHPIVDKFKESHPEVEVEFIDVDDESDRVTELINNLRIKSVPTTVYYVDNEIKNTKFGLLSEDKLNNLIK